MYKCFFLNSSIKYKQHSVESFKSSGACKMAKQVKQPRLRGTVLSSSFLTLERGYKHGGREGLNSRCLFFSNDLKDSYEPCILSVTLSSS